MITLGPTTATATHLLYDGKGGWIEAVACQEDCWVDEENPTGTGWQFWRTEDLLRWLRS